MNALAPHTNLLFENATQLECIKPFLLVGGTALSNVIMSVTRNCYSKHTMRR